MDWFLYDNGLRHERVVHSKCLLAELNDINDGYNTSPKFHSTVQS